MEQDFITCFDTLYTNNHIQICKMAMMLMPPEKQKFAAVIIKYLELNYTLQLCLNMSTNEATNKTISIQQFLPMILPFCTESEAATVKNIISIQKTFDSFEQMKPVLDLLSQMDTNADNSMDLLKNLLSPEQIDLFDMFKEAL